MTVLLILGILLLGCCVLGGLSVVRARRDEAHMRRRLDAAIGAGMRDPS